ncbi:hypothetical protein BWI97_07285 [Siphonobacter sp. BAB-5405]|uniref:hypothetical protein n=1 Tax=Siphonobacter sp. BAB-5405 TaxID=1864825 RepID=UPI000C80C9A2|nr:hypothetical protein [Siphonobacter sp. BAB-5405]PMD97426.1 hypothetical protein BWI97_07285 [Siphonobacter sp. BAB-5405]
MNTSLLKTLTPEQTQARIEKIKLSLANPNKYFFEDVDFNLQMSTKLNQLADLQSNLVIMQTPAFKSYEASGKEIDFREFLEQENLYDQLEGK